MKPEKIHEASLSDVIMEVREYMQENESFVRIRHDQRTVERVYGLFEGTNETDQHIFNILDELQFAAVEQAFQFIKCTTRGWNEQIDEHDVLSLSQWKDLWAAAKDATPGERLIMGALYNVWTALQDK